MSTTQGPIFSPTAADFGLYDKGRNSHTTRLLPFGRPRVLRRRQTENASSAPEGTRFTQYLWAGHARPNYGTRSFAASATTSIVAMRPRTTVNATAAIGRPRGATMNPAAPLTIAGRTMGANECAACQHRTRHVGGPGDRHPIPGRAGVDALAVAA